MFDTHSHSLDADANGWEKRCKWMQHAVHCNRLTAISLVYDVYDAFQIRCGKQLQNSYWFGIHNQSLDADVKEVDAASARCTVAG